MNKNSEDHLKSNTSSDEADGEVIDTSTEGTNICL